MSATSQVGLRDSTNALRSSEPSSPVRNELKEIFMASTPQSSPIHLSTPPPHQKYQHPPQSLAIETAENQFKKALQLEKEIQVDDFIIPTRRFPPPGIRDTCIVKHGMLTPEKGKTGFIKRKEIVKVHSMKYLPSPFVSTITNSKLKGTTIFQMMNQTRAQALAITPDEKHVMLQQAQSAAKPTAIAMLILDQGGTPDFKAMTKGGTQWVKEVGFEELATKLDSTDKKAQLIELLTAHGPGVLNIFDRHLQNHHIVLHAISEETNTATLCDPYHGWMVTIKLEELLKSRLIEFTHLKPTT